MLQHNGRVATQKLVLRHCFRYLQITLIIGAWDWSQNLCEVMYVKMVRKIQQNYSFSKVFLVHLSWKVCGLTLIIHKTFRFHKIDANKGSVVSKFQASIRGGIFALISHTLFNFVICQIKS